MYILCAFSSTMASEALFGEFGEVCARLVDHRAVLHGEINYFLTEFEKNRGDRDESHLKKTLEYTREIEEKLIPKSVTVMETNMPTLMEKLESANEKCQKILTNEGHSSKDEWLKSERKARAEAWEAFMEEMCDASSHVDRQHEDEIERVKQYYTDLEQKLSITANQ